MYSVVPGALMEYYINDFAISLAPRKLLIAAVIVGNGGRTDIEDSDKDIDVIRKAYTESNAGIQLDIKSTESIEKFDHLFKEWIK